MMKKHFTVRLMALMLAALMMGAAFSACSQTQQIEQTEQTQEIQTAEKTEESAQASEQTKEGQWEFTDSLGRTVSFEGQIERVAPSGNMAQQCLFSIAADKMVGRAGEVAKNAEVYYGEEFVNLPVFGAFYGSKSDLNKEAVIAADPQVIIDIGEVKDGMKEELDDLQEQLGIPVVFIEADLEGTGTAFRTLGQLLDCEEEANKIADYCDQTMQDAQEKSASIPQEERKSVYYGLNENGLSSFAQGSFHTEVIELVGADNCVQVEGAGSGAMEISFEQLLNWNPDVLLFGEQSMADGVANDPVWQELTAVQEGNYSKIPSEPYSFLDQPPAANRVIGVKWLGNLLYPEIYDYDMVKEVQEFYSLFYHYDLTEEQAQEILGR